MQPLVQQYHACMQEVLLGNDVLACCCVCRSHTRLVLLQDYVVQLPLRAPAASVAALLCLHTCEVLDGACCVALAALPEVLHV